MHHLEGCAAILSWLHATGCCAFDALLLLLLLLCFMAAPVLRDCCQGAPLRCHQLTSRACPIGPAAARSRPSVFCCVLGCGAGQVSAACKAVVGSAVCSCAGSEVQRKGGGHKTRFWVCESFLTGFAPNIVIPQVDTSRPLFTFVAAGCVAPILPAE